MTTTIQYSKTTDTFHVVNEARSAYVPHSEFYSRLTDSDLLDAAKHAVECAGEVVAVPSFSNARGLKPRNAQRFGVIQ